MENYIAAKRRIFARQGREEAAVIGVDDPICQRIATEMTPDGVGPRVVRISNCRALHRGAHAVGGVLYDAVGPRAAEVLDLRTARALQGRHNWQNAAAAYAAVRALGLDPRRIAEGLATFPGLAHRMEEVAQIGRVRIVNDSKATNANAARQALASYENIYWIAGGRMKEGGLGELAPLMARVAKGYLIGEGAEAIASQLKGRAAFEISRELKTALEHAVADAQASPRPDPVVLLSPACASFDQFRSFEHRGDVFRDLAQSLPGAILPGTPTGAAA
jgi:UDP-N-acetylmuramoylalanine--D-glutamate ligase